jgi:hypothetical protein
MCLAVLFSLLAGGLVARARPVDEPAPSGLPPGAPPSDTLKALRSAYLFPQLPPEVVRLQVLAASRPGSSISTFTAFGADWRDVYAAAVYQRRTRFPSRRRDVLKADGAVAFGIGLGDARRLVGLEITAALYDLLPEEGDRYREYSVSFKLHRRLSDDLALAAGVENLLADGENDGGTSAYGVVTKVFRLRDTPNRPFSRLTTSLGVGNGRFRSEDRIYREEDGANVFGSVGLLVARPLAVVGDWTGQDLNLGLSIAPLRHVPLIITPALADVTGRAGDGTRFILGVGLGYSFY